MDDLKLSLIGCFKSNGLNVSVSARILDEEDIEYLRSKYFNVQLVGVDT